VKIICRTWRLIREWSYLLTFRLSLHLLDSLVTVKDWESDDTRSNSGTSQKRRRRCFVKPKVLGRRHKACACLCVIQRKTHSMCMPLCHTKHGHVKFHVNKRTRASVAWWRSCHKSLVPQVPTLPYLSPSCIKKIIVSTYFSQAVWTRSLKPCIKVLNSLLKARLGTARESPW